MARSLDSSSPVERVLLVDDSSFVRRFVSRMLQRGGYGVTTAGGGAAALGLIRGTPSTFDILVTGVRMPGMDGVELARRARTAAPSLRILLLARDPRSVTDACTDGDHPPVLAMPFSVEELHAAVRGLHNGTSPRGGSVAEGGAR